ncbi:MAG: Gfo/Idh/MocA family protein [Thermomicrobiales bacterium]
MPGKGERRLRIGVLGCGQIAQAAHFESCRKARNADLYAICDRAPDLLARMAAVHQPAAAYGDYDAMLADPLVDAVIVAIADQFHVDAAIAALRAGKPVLVEKPMAVSVEEAERLAAAVAETGLPVQVGTMKRYDPGIAFARQFIREEMGEIVAMEAWYCDSSRRYAMTDATQPLIETSAYALRPAGDPKADLRRYYLLGHGSHLVDMAIFLCGEIGAVRARQRHAAETWTWFIETEFVSGAIGHLNLTIPAKMDWHEGFTVYGEHGSAAATIFNPWYFKGAEVECFSERDGQFRRPLGADAHFYRRQVEGFADTVLDGAPMTGASAVDGLAVTRALAAISRSVESGGWVLPADVTGAI